jgi:hypothetical protein
LLGLVLFGVALRLLFLFWAGDLDLHADESYYSYHALVWLRFGFYGNAEHWLWPPGYPAFLAACFSLFGAHGIWAAKVSQVLCSALIGASVVLLARRFFSKRAATWAGLLWAVHLPLIAYTHYLRPECLFTAVLLPLAYVLVVILDLQPSRRLTLLLLLAGLLLGFSLLLRESLLPLWPLLIWLLLRHDSHGGMPARLGNAALLSLACATVIWPWVLRNQEVYGRWAPAGATLGQNLYNGLNRDYKNLDYPKVAWDELYSWDHPTYRWLIYAPRPWGWQRSDAPNIMDRGRENLSRAGDFVSEHPWHALRTRLKKIADAVTPMSFFVRHHWLGLYRGAITQETIRAVLCTWALLLTALLFAAALPGLFWSLTDSNSRRIMVAIGLCFVASILLVSNSRFRAPLEPLLAVFAAGFLGGCGRPWWPRKRASAGVVLGVLILLALWLMNAKEILMVWERVA